MSFRRIGEGIEQVHEEKSYTPCKTVGAGHIRFILPQHDKPSMSVENGILFMK